MKTLTDDKFVKLVSGAVRSAVSINGGRITKKEIGSTANTIVNQLNAALIQMRSQEFQSALDERAKSDWDAKVTNLEQEVEKYKKENRTLREKLGYI